MMESNYKPLYPHDSEPVSVNVEGVPPLLMDIQISRSVTTDTEGLVNGDSAFITSASSGLNHRGLSDAFAKFLQSQTTTEILVEKDIRPITEKKRKNTKSSKRAKKRREHLIRKSLEELLLDWKDLSFRGFVQTIFSLI